MRSPNIDVVLKDIRRLQKTWAPRIIIDGLLGDEQSEAQDVVCAKVDQEFKPRIEAFLSRLEKAGIDLKVPFPRDDNPDATEDVGDAMYTYVLHYAEEAYLLGVAVGLQLDSQTFQKSGGAR
jgi:hypothetical protein